MPKPPKPPAPQEVNVHELHEPASRSHVAFIVVVVLLIASIIGGLMVWLQKQEAEGDADYTTQELAVCEQEHDACGLQVEHLEETLALMEEMAEEKENEEFSLPGGSVSFGGLSFAYPEDVIVQAIQPLGGSSEIQRTYEFLYLDESGVLKDVGYNLNHNYSLEEDIDGGVVFQDVVDHWLQYEDIAHEGEVGGKRYLMIETGDMSGDAVTYYIESEQEGIVYRIRGNFLQHPYANDVITELLSSMSFE